MAQNFFSAEIVRCPLAAAHREDAVRQMGRLLVDEGYVTADYIDGVLAREAEFPTGLALQNGSIAIPHANPEGNVLRSGIAVAKLERPVVFQSMENPEEAVAAEVVFLLALKDQQQHLEMLKNLFLSFQQPAFVQALVESGDADALLRALREQSNIA